MITKLKRDNQKLTLDSLKDKTYSTKPPPIIYSIQNNFVKFPFEMTTNQHEYIKTLLTQLKSEGQIMI